jgi:surface polysaccharide O-acyltransferase-like enzyme
LTVICSSLFYYYYSALAGGRSNSIVKGNFPAALVAEVPLCFLIMYYLHQMVEVHQEEGYYKVMMEEALKQDFDCFD